MEDKPEGQEGEERGCSIKDEHRSAHADSRHGGDEETTRRDPRARGRKTPMREREDWCSIADRSPSNKHGANEKYPDALVRLEDEWVQPRDGHKLTRRVGRSLLPPHQIQKKKSTSRISGY